MHILDSLTSSSKKYQWRSKIIGEILHENMVQCCRVACEWLSRGCTYRFKVEYNNDNNNYNSIVSCRHCTKTVFFECAVPKRLLVENNLSRVPSSYAAFACREFASTIISRVLFQLIENDFKHTLHKCGFFPCAPCTCRYTTLIY